MVSPKPQSLHGYATTTGRVLTFPSSVFCSQAEQFTEPARKSEFPQYQNSFNDNHASFTVVKTTCKYTYIHTESSKIDTQQAQAQFTYKIRTGIHVCKSSANTFTPTHHTHNSVVGIHKAQLSINGGSGTAIGSLPISRQSFRMDETVHLFLVGMPGVVIRPLGMRMKLHVHVPGET